MTTMIVVLISAPDEPEPGPSRQAPVLSFHSRYRKSAGEKGL